MIQPVAFLMTLGTKPLKWKIINYYRFVHHRKMNTLHMLTYYLLNVEKAIRLCFFDNPIHNNLNQNKGAHTFRSPSGNLAFLRSLTLRPFIF